MTNYEWCELSGMTFKEIQEAYLHYCRKQNCKNCPVHNENCDCVVVWLYSDTKATEDVEDN